MIRTMMFASQDRSVIVFRIMSLYRSRGDRYEIIHIERDGSETPINAESAPSDVQAWIACNPI